MAGRLYFGASDPTNGAGLWASDGTAAGTVLVQSGFNSVPAKLTPLSTSVFFTTPAGGGLWTSDGTSAGTTLLQSAYASNLTAVGDKLFFAGLDGKRDKGHELRVSDGTANGTKLVKDIYPGSFRFLCRDRGRKWCSEANDSAPTWLTDLNGTLLFVADDGEHGRELWRSDGTGKGTKLVKDITPGEQSSNPRNLLAVNGELYFSAPGRLWKSDGTTDGTVLVKAVFPSNLTNVNGTLFFSASDGATGVELWKSDGTAAGTVLVKDIIPGSAGASPEALTNANGTLLFTANDGAAGEELWKSDGTAAGNVLVKDINPGSGGAQIDNLTNVNGMVYFTANDGVHGFQLWQSDGTAAGTERVEDIYPDYDFSDPDDLTSMNNKLYFAATDPVHGRELWDPPPVGRPNSEPVPTTAFNDVVTVNSPVADVPGSLILIDTLGSVIERDEFERDSTEILDRPSYAVFIDAALTSDSSSDDAMESFDENPARDLPVDEIDTNGLFAELDGSLLDELLSV